MRVFASAPELAAAVGTELGVSGWVEIAQERIDRFAEATASGSTSTRGAPGASRPTGRRWRMAISRSRCCRSSSTT
jgi:hypothetical protein